MADGRHFEKFYRYISAGNHPISTKFGVLMQIVLPRSATQQYTIPFTVFLIFHNWDRWGKRKTNRFSHFARSEGYRNRFVSRLSHFVLNTAIGKTEYGFVFRFHWYRTEWGKQIHGIYTDRGCSNVPVLGHPVLRNRPTFQRIHIVSQRLSDGTAVA